MGKTLVVLGAAIVALGLLLMLGERFQIQLGRLPGDISIKRDHWSFHFPLTTCLLLSGLLSLVLWLARKR